MTRRLSLHAIGYWLATKCRRQAAEVGVYQVARNLRKQGVPLDVALTLLSTRL